MSKLSRVAILSGLVVSLVLGLSWPLDAAILEVSAGISQANTVWQTSPPAFAQVTRWSGVGLSLLLGRFTLGMGITILDFETMRIKYPPSFDLSIGFGITRIYGASLSVGGGVVVTPSINWIGLYAGVGLSMNLVQNLRGSVGIAVETTRGAAGSFFVSYPPGTAIVASFGVSWALRLF